MTRRDIVNVSSETWRKKIRNGRVIHAEIADMQSNCRVSMKAIDLDNGRISSANGKPNFSGDLAVVKAARHVLSDGNSVLASRSPCPNMIRSLLITSTRSRHSYRRTR